MSNVNTAGVYFPPPSVETDPSHDRFSNSTDCGRVLSYIFTIMVFVVIGVVCFAGPTSEVYNDSSRFHEDEELEEPSEEFCQFLMQELEPFSAILQEKVVNSRNALQESNSTYITTFDRKKEDTLKSQAYGSTLLLSPNCLPAASVIRSNINLYDPLMIPCAGLPLKKSLPSPVTVLDTELVANPIHMANREKQFPLDARNIDEARLLLPAIEHWNCPSPRQYEAQSVNLTPWQQNWRLFPESCAICLDEFQDKEKVSWSSNPRCFHVFHQECIYDWLVMNQKENQRKPMKRSKEKSLLSCPCCRQSFVSSRGIADG